jgi:hypothetical protein
MPKRTTKRYRYEAECERRPWTAAQTRRHRIFSIKRATTELEEWRQAVTDIERFYSGPRAAMGAYTLGEFSLARQLAHDTLLLADLYRDDWNYGNAIHFAHTVLGLLALRNGDTRLACEELEKSGETPGSPQLGSFGPTMRLAKELLNCRESPSVLRYFQQCRRFWKMGETWLSIWEKKVARGAMPVFFGHI